MTPIVIRDNWTLETSENVWSKQNIPTNKNSMKRVKARFWGIKIVVSLVIKFGRNNYQTRITRGK